MTCTAILITLFLQVSKLKQVDFFIFIFFYSECNERQFLV